MIYGPIDEAKRIKGQEYDKLRKKAKIDYYAGKVTFDKDSTEGNHYGTTSVGKGGALDSIAQHHISDLDVEKEKTILESENILNEYMAYLNGQFDKANTVASYQDESKSQIEKRMIEDYDQLVDLGISESDAKELAINNYYGVSFLNKLKDSDKILAIKIILRMRINYVNKITSLMAKMLKSNYKLLGLSEEQAEIYINSLKSGSNDAVKTAGEIKNKIRSNTDKFITNNGQSVDLRSLGFGVILGPSEGYKLNFVGTDGSNEDGMMSLIQKAMSYDVVVVAHGSDRSAFDHDGIFNTIKKIRSKNNHDSQYERYNDEINNEFKAKFLDAYQFLKDSQKFSITAYIVSALDRLSLYNSPAFEYIDKNEDEILDLIKETSESKIESWVDKVASEIKSDIYVIYKQKEGESIHDFIYKYITNNIYNNISSNYDDDFNKVKNDIISFLKTSQVSEIIDGRIHHITCNMFLSAFEKRINNKYKHIWHCQPTRTLKAGPFEDVNHLVRQLIKEGFKKILIEDCNPGGHKLADDIMKTPGILINHSDFSNWVESLIIDSTDPDILAINEAELSLKEFAESFDIDYSNDEYLEECCQWYLKNAEYIEEGVIDSLKEFFKKILAGIINFFKKIFEFVKTAFYKLKTLFNGTKEAPKNTKTNFQKPITTPLIDIESKKTIKIQCTNREELENESSKMCVKFSNIIKEFNKKHQEAMKRINQDIEQLEKQVQNESYGGIDLMSKFLLEDMDLFDVFDDNYLLEFEADGQPTEEEDKGDEFSMDDEGSGDDTPAPPAEGEGEPAPASEEPPAEDGPPADDNEGEEFSMDEDPPEEGPEDEGEDNYEIPDDEGGEGQEGGGDDAPPAEDGPPADDGEDEFSMDSDSGEGGGDAEGGEGQAPADDAPTDDTSGEEGEDSETNTKLKELEEIIFDELSEDEKNMKIVELKNLYITVYKKCGTIHEMLSGIKKDEETIQIVEYISNTLIDLKEYVNDYINKVFDSKTYIENLSQLQKYIAIFNAIHQVFNQIKTENEE